MTSLIVNEKRRRLIYEDYFDVVSVSGFHDRLREYAAKPRAGYLRSRR